MFLAAVPFPGVLACPAFPALKKEKRFIMEYPPKFLRKIVGTKKQTNSVTIYILTFSQNSNEKGNLKFTMKIFLESQDEKNLKNIQMNIT